MPSLSDLFPKTKTLHLLAGSPQAGKSTLVAQLAKAALDREPFLGFAPFEPEIKGVTYVVVDRPLEDNKRAFDLLGLHRRVNIVELAGTQEWKAILSSIEIRKAKRIFAPNSHAFEKAVMPHIHLGHLVVIDVLGPQIIGDLHRDSAVGANLTNIQCMLSEQRKDAVILGLSYGVKVLADPAQNYRFPIDNIIGCSTMRGKMSTLAYLSSPPVDDGPAQYLYVGPRCVEHQRVELVWRGGLLVMKEKEEKAEEVGVEPLTPREQEILDLIPFGQEFSTGELTERLDLDKSYLVRVLKRLHLVGELQYPRRGTWLRQVPS